MNNKFKFKWSLMASSVLLAFFGLGIRGNADTTPKQTAATTPVQTQTVTVGSSFNASSDASALHIGEYGTRAKSTSSSLKGGLEGSNVGTKSNEAVNDSQNKVSLSSSSVGTTTVSSGDAVSSGSTTTTYGSASDNNVDSTSSSDKEGSGDGASSSSTATSNDGDQGTAASSSSSSSQPMLGLGDRGSAAAGSGVDKTVKTIIDKVAPKGGLDSSKPQVNSAAAGTQSATSSSDTTGAANASSSANVSQTQSGQNNDVTSAAAMAQANHQTSIEKPKSAGAISQGSFANRVAKEDNNGAKKNTTKLVSFDTFSDLFYKQAAQVKKSPGKFTTSKGKKVTITTPVSSVKYSDNDENGVMETLPVIITLSIIGLVALSFIVFDPLRFIFR